MGFLKRLFGGGDDGTSCTSADDCDPDEACVDGACDGSGQMVDEGRQTGERRLHEVEEQQHEISIKLNECRLKMQTLEERVRDDYQMELAERVEGYVPDEVDWEAIEEEITALRTKIERLGSVNVEAIKEQEEQRVAATTSADQIKILITINIYQGN